MPKSIVVGGSQCGPALWDVAMNRRLFVAALRDGLVLLQCTSLAPLPPVRAYAGESQMDDSRYLTLFLIARSDHVD